MEERISWPSERAYSHKSTLKTLAHCVSGRDLPDDLIEGNTLETSINPARDSQAGMIMAADLQDRQSATVDPDARSDVRDARLRVSNDSDPRHDGKEAGDFGEKGQ